MSRSIYISLFLIVLFFCQVPELVGQKYFPEYNVALIADTLKEDALAVVRKDKIVYDIDAINELVRTRETAITILEHRGIEFSEIFVGYKNGFDKLKDFSISILDEDGNIIKEVKSKEILDHAAYDGFSMASDYRYKYYKPLISSFPVTIVYSYEVQSNSTYYLPTWPFLHSRMAIESSELKFNTAYDFEILYKVLNPEGPDYSLEVGMNGEHFSLKNFKAPKSESYTSEESRKNPKVLFSPKRFKYGETEGEFSDWKTYGDWMQNNYLFDKADLTKEDIPDLVSLVSGVNTDFEKAKLIYDYAVHSTRYVSIQLGDGGHVPFYASEVHENKYGDCKALSMYTKNLMNLFDVEALYTVVEAGRSKDANFDDEFASIGQGNHIILTLPMDGDTIWAECTSDKVPLGHYSSFTSGRKVLAIDESGGKIVKTKSYTWDQNLLSHQSEISFDLALNSMEIKINQELGGILTKSRLYLDKNISTKELVEKYYPSFFKQFKSDVFSDIQYELVDPHTFREELKVVKNNALSKAGDYLLVPAVLLKSSLKEISAERKADIYFENGFKKSYRYKYELPGGYYLKELQVGGKIESTFGSYSLTFIQEDGAGIIVQVDHTFKSGSYSAEEVENYNNWIKEIKDLENKKLLFSLAKP